MRGALRQLRPCARCAARREAMYKVARKLGDDVLRQMQRARQALDQKRRR